MLKNTFWDVIKRVKLHFYKNIFSKFETREASLTAVETFCVEVIDALERPTINEFAKYVNISPANAAYKVQNLIEKGYVRKERSTIDKREYYLVMTDRYQDYAKVTTMYLNTVMDRIVARFTKDEVESFNRMLTIISDELMRETDRR